MGAWEEVLDRLAELDVPVSNLTPTEVGAAAARLAPASSSPMGQLSILVDDVVYGAAPVSEEVANRAWDASDEVARALSAATPLGQRLRSLSPWSRRPDRARI
jgi:hypothetical protein